MASIFKREVQSQILAPLPATLSTASKFQVKPVAPAALIILYSTTGPSPAPEQSQVLRTASPLALRISMGATVDGVTIGITYFNGSNGAPVDGAFGTVTNSGVIRGTNRHGVYLA